jgi:hypothetical protein
MPDLKPKSGLTIMAATVELSPTAADESLEQQVQNVADSVTHMIVSSMERKQSRGRAN